MRLSSAFVPTAQADVAEDQLSMVDGIADILLILVGRSSKDLVRKSLGLSQVTSGKKPPC